MDLCLQANAVNENINYNYLYLECRHAYQNNGLFPNISSLQLLDVIFLEFIVLSTDYYFSPFYITCTFRKKVCFSETRRDYYKWTERFTDIYVKNSLSLILLYTCPSIYMYVYICTYTAFAEFCIY